MKKLLYIIAGVSLASVTRLSGVALGDGKGDPEMGGNTWVQMAQQKNWNSAKSNTSTAVKDREGEDEDGDDIPQGSGDPMKGLLGGKGTPCKPCPVPFGGTVNTGGDEGDAAQAKDFNTTRSSDAQLD